MSLETLRSPMVDETAFVVSRASFSRGHGLVVVDATVGQVLAVGRDLKVESRFGRKGQGPGELARPLDAGIDSDGRVWVLDAAPSTLVLFDPDGNFVKEVPLRGAPDRIAVSDDGIYVSSPVPNASREVAFVWRYDPKRDEVTPALSFDPSMADKPPFYRNVITRTIPKIGMDDEFYVGFEEANEVWRVHDDGSYEVVVRGCIPSELQQAYNGSGAQGRRTGVLLSDFSVTADGRVLLRGGLLAEGGGRPWAIYSDTGQPIRSWSLVPPGLLNLYVAIDPLDPSTHLNWDRGSGSAKLVRVVPGQRR